MHLPVPSEYEQFVRDCLASGRYASELELARAAIEMLDREQTLGEIDAGLEELDRGEFTEYGEGDDEKFIADIMAEAERLRNQSSLQ